VAYKLGKVFCAVLIATMIFTSTTFSSDLVKVNINIATVEELTSLKGIGSVIAEKVVEYRKHNGPFTTCEDIMKISGIGEKIFKNNKDMITVELQAYSEAEEKKE